MRYTVAGRSVSAFGGAILLGSAAAAFFLDALIIDPLAIAALLLGTNVSGGSARACRWAIALMLYYAFAATFIVAFSVVRPGPFGVGRHTLLPAELLWARAVCGAFGVWSVVNIALLLQARQPSEPTQ